MKINYCKKNKTDSNNGLLVLFAVSFIFLGIIYVCACQTSDINKKYTKYIELPAAIEYMDRKWDDGNTGWYHLQDCPISVKKSLINYIEAIKNREDKVRRD